MKKILVAEDEQDLRENIVSLLEIKDFEIISATDGLDALKKIETTIPDLIISDIMMPYLDGYELLRRTKENIKTKFVPFLFLTAKSDLSSIRQGMGLGADDYITKPFSSEDLVNAINIRLKKSEGINERIDEIRNSISTYVPHELRTPLVAILGYSQIILSDIDNLKKEEIKDMTDRINFGAKRLYNRIEKFIQLSDLEPVVKDIWIKNEIGSTISNDEIKIISLEHHIIKERFEKFVLSIEPEVIKIPERFLRIIIRELLENAVKFSQPDSQIIINGKKEGGFYILEITDFGIGMEDFQISSIGAFQQFERDNFQQEGNGLGLVFVLKVMNNIGGEIKIKSEKYKYTTVTLRFLISDN